MFVQRGHRRTAVVVPGASENHPYNNVTTKLRASRAEKTCETRRG